MPRDGVPPVPLLSARSLAKGFGAGEARVEIFASVELDVLPGDFLAIMGPSGSGKSTLLHLLAGLDRPDAGRVLLGGADLAELSPERRALLRGEAIGFVFQFHHLLPELTAEENVALPLFLAGEGEKEGREAAREVLARVGLSPRAGALPRTLSGGERQRVAIARAVVRRPRLHLLAEVARERAGAVVLVTHDAEWAHRCASMKTLTAEGLVAAH